MLGAISNQNQKRFLLREGPIANSLIWSRLFGIAQVPVSCFPSFIKCRSKAALRNVFTGAAAIICRAGHADAKVWSDHDLI